MMDEQNALINPLQVAGMNLHYYYYPLEYFLDSQLHSGCSTIELWGGTPHIWVDHLSFSNLAHIKKQTKMRNQSIAVFTPEYSSYRYLLCTSDADIHSKSLAYYANCLQITAELGAKTMCINMTGRFCDEDYSDAWKRCINSVGYLCEIACSLGIDLAIETLSPEQSAILNTLEELKNLFREVRSKQLKVAMDIVSISSSGESIEQWFDAFNQDIVHVHFTDGRNDGSHLVWGDGCFPLQWYLTQLNIQGYKGLISPNLFSRKYFADPVTADKRNQNALNKYFALEREKE